MIGLVVLVVGAEGLVRGASRLAAMAGIPPLVIGLTIVAFGTSSPELAVSVMSVWNGGADIALVNVLGSNILNILAALGLAATVAPEGVAVSQEALQFDIPVMIAVAVASLPIFFSGALIGRWEGLVFFGYYVVYTTYLVLVAIQSPTLEALNRAMVWFVLPLTALTLAIGLWRSYRMQTASETDLMGSGI